MNLDKREKEVFTTVAEESEFQDVTIDCVDCDDDFVWTVGEQEFFRDKGLKHPPKRCKPCKKAKTARIEAIELAESKGKRKIEIEVVCDQCSIETTVPFYPTQGRPVLCRSCFLKNKRFN